MIGAGYSDIWYSIENKGLTTMLSNEYVAGLFDGEGNVHISKDICHLTTSITQKDPMILYLLKKQFGGNVCKYGKVTCHKWRVIGCEKNENFLKAIYPYSIIKKSEIWIALMFLADQTKENLRYNPLTGEQKDLRFNCRNSLLSIHGDRYGHLV